MPKKTKSSDKKFENDKKEESKELTCLLSKFNKEDIIKSVVETSQNRLQVSTITKAKLIKDAISILTEKFSDLDELLLFLYLKYGLTQKKKRIWNIMEINDGKRFKQPHLSPEKISESLFKYCNKNYISCKVLSEKQEGCMLSVAFLGENKPKKPSYFVSHLKLSLIFYHSVPSNYKSNILQILRKSYKGKHINELPNLCTNIHYIKETSINDKFLSQYLKNKGVENPAVHLDKNIITGRKNIKDKNVNNLKKHSTTEKTEENNGTYILRSKVNLIKKKSNNPSDNFVSFNTKKINDLKDSQNNSVSINVEENASEYLHDDVQNHKTKTRKKPNRLVRNFTAYNVEADKDDLQNFICLKRKASLSDQLQTNVQNCNRKDDSFEDNASLLPPRVKKKKHSYSFINDTVSCETGKEKFSKKLQNDVMTYGKSKKTKINNNLNSTYVINNDRIEEIHDDLLNSTFIINNARNSEDGSLDSQVESVFTGTESQCDDKESRKYFKKTEKNDQNNLEERNLVKTENLKYIMKTSFFGSYKNTNSVCIVNFHGADVLKGFEKLIEYDMVDASLPQYISEEPKSGKTEFIVKL